MDLKNKKIVAPISLQERFGPVPSTMRTLADTDFLNDLGGLFS